MSETSDITLLISTYDWPQALDLVLKSVAIQSQMPLEVVIADDGSGPDTKALIERYKTVLPVPLIHVWHEDIGFRKSLILNKAISNSRGKYIVQIDGDIILHKHFLRDHLRRRAKGFFVAGARAAIGKEKSTEILSTGQIKFSIFTRGMDTTFNAIRLPSLSFLFRGDPSSSGNVKGCNLAFWKADFVKINGYFSGFEGWGWEDYELAQRFINAGVGKRRLKWAAVCYHIFHPLNSRGNSEANENVYRESVREKTVQRFPGLSDV